MKQKAHEKPEPESGADTELSGQTAAPIPRAKAHFNFSALVSQGLKALLPRLKSGAPTLALLRGRPHVGGWPTGRGCVGCSLRLRQMSLRLHRGDARYIVRAEWRGHGERTRGAPPALCLHHYVSLHFSATHDGPCPADLHPEDARAANRQRFVQSRGPFLGAHFWNQLRAGSGNGNSDGISVRDELVGVFASCGWRDRPDACDGGRVFIFSRVIVSRAVFVWREAAWTARALAFVADDVRRIVAFGLPDRGDRRLDAAPGGIFAGE